MGCENDINEEFAIEAERTNEPRKILDQMMIKEPIRRLEPRQPPICVTSDKTVADVIELMRIHLIGSVLVNQDEQLIGIVTERDILCKVTAIHANPQELLAKDVMTLSPATLTLDDPIVFALNKMGVGGFRHVPLVDEQNRPIAIISVRHIVRYVTDFFAKEVMNLPPEPGMDVGRNREGA